MKLIIDRTADLEYVRRAMNDFAAGVSDRATTMTAMGIMYFHLDVCLKELEEFKQREKAAAETAPPPRRGNVIPFPGCCGRQPLAKQVRK